MTSLGSIRRRSRVQTQTGTPAATPIAVQIGTNPAMPAAVGERVMSGSLAITVQQVDFGAEGTEMVMAAWPWNPPPVDGYSYLVIEVEIENTGDREMAVDFDDFGFVTEARRVWKSQGLVPPDPALDHRLAPGEQATGWVAGTVEADASRILMIFNCRAQGGTWSERFVALTDGARLPTDEIAPLAANSVGANIAAPALLGEAVITDDWSLTITDLRYAADVVALFPVEDYRTTALASADPTVIPLWIAFQITVRHTGGSLSALHFPVDAINLAMADGSAQQDVRILSAPLPEVSGTYLPGGTGVGWYLIELPVGYTGDLLRFQPRRTDADVRFLRWGAGHASALSNVIGTN